MLPGGGASVNFPPHRVSQRLDERSGDVMRTTPWLWLPLLLTCAPCFAQGQPAIAAQCTQCRDNAATQQRKCEAAARAPAQREACGTSGAQAQNACAEGACKGLAT